MQNATLTRTNLRTPKAAAIAGMLFSLLTVARLRHRACAQMQ